MKTGLRKDDTFRDKIREILLNGPSLSPGGDFRSRVFAQVQDYSRELQEAEHASDFFFRLCELIVDCQSLGIPDDSFRIIVAGLLVESENSNGPMDEEVQQLIGMDPASYESAKQHFKDKQCIASVLNREKTDRKSSMMAGKKSFSIVEQVDEGM
ncbi:MAG TPA: hypothetical protein HPP81_08495 [Deltaproteobacteria bacterium]|jgi:hypothetical protein|nr:hypothetical protein [Deltaproteobacteria bacterium]